MRPSLAFTALVASGLAACAMSPETPGQVYQTTDSSVTIRGPYQTGARVVAPSAAMVRQAEAVCIHARYESATPSPADFDTYLYLFRCPSGLRKG